MDRYFKKNDLDLKKFTNMNEQLKGLIRHALTFIGGVAIAKGWASDSNIAELIGAVMTIVGSVWSYTSKK